MNAIEFKEMQEEFAEFIYHYEAFNKLCYLGDLRYTYHFHDILMENHRLEMECGLLQSALQMLSNNVSTKNIDQFITRVKNDYNNKKEQIIKKYEFSKNIVNGYDAIPQEEKDNFEEYFKEFITVYYPPVKVIAPKELKPIVELLRKCYVEGRNENFKEIFELNKNAFIFPEIPEDQYIAVSQFYYDYKKNINKEVAERKKTYPYTKSDVFNDEMTIASEEGELKLRNSNLLKMNAALHKDYIQAFSIDLKLE